MCTTRSTREQRSWTTWCWREFCRWICHLIKLLRWITLFLTQEIAWMYGRSMLRLMMASFGMRLMDHKNQAFPHWIEINYENWPHNKRLYLTVAPIGTELFFLAGYKVRWWSIGKNQRTMSCPHVWHISHNKCMEELWANGIEGWEGTLQPLLYCATLMRHKDTDKGKELYDETCGIGCA